MTSDRRRAVVSLVLVTGVLGGCADLSRGAANPVADAGAEQGEAGGGASFATGVHPLLLSACGGCHAAGEEAGDTGLLFSGDPAADLVRVRNFVNTDAPASSRLVAKMSGNGHQGGTVFAAGTQEYTTVLAWIQGGALP
jgi:hypothetical protein